MILPEGISVVQLKYHLIVIAIYVLICGYFFFVKSSPSLYFTFEKKDLVYFFLITLSTTLALFFANKILHYGTVGVNSGGLRGIILVIFYSILFAVPEEILFRGIIAKNLGSIFQNVLLAVFISAVIFGIAHLFNGALGFWPPSLWDWQLSGMTFFAGLFLGWLYFATGSLVLPIALHALLIILNYAFLL